MQNVTHGRHFEPDVMQAKIAVKAKQRIEGTIQSL
jgi:hypothetical protein